MSEINLKNVKISSQTAFIRSKWSNNTVRLWIFVHNTESGKCDFYKGETSKEEILKQCSALNTNYEKIKYYLSSQEDIDGIFYNIENHKFTVFVKEIFEDDEYADIIYFKLQVIHQEVPKEWVDIWLEDFDDLSKLTNELANKNALINKLNGDFKDICDSYQRLVAEKKAFESKIYNQMLELLNAKKKFIQENISNNMNISKDLDASNDNSNIQVDQQPSTSQTPKRKTPIKQRTPSKRFLEMPQTSDSDDSFKVFPCDSIKSSKSCVRRPNNEDQLNSSGIFNNFKIKKTPVKHNEEKRESSVELKIAKSNRNTTDDECENLNKPIEKSIEVGQNAQNLEHEVLNRTQVELSQMLMDEDVQCSQDILSSYCDQKSIKSKHNKFEKSRKKNADTPAEINPYDVDTINILNFSE